MMDTSGQSLSQKTSFFFSSTPAQSQDLAVTDIYRQTQVLLSDILKEKNQQNSDASPSKTSSRQRPTGYLMLATTVFKLRSSKYCRSTSAQMHRINQQCSIRD